VWLGGFFLRKSHPAVIFERGIVPFILHNFLRKGFAARSYFELHGVPFVRATFEHFGKRTAGFPACHTLLTLRK